MLTSSLAPAQENRPERRPKQGFEAFLDAIRAEAAYLGIPATIVADTLSRIEPPEPSEPEDQPEFIEPIWSYLDRAASRAKIDHGAAQSRRHRTFLDTLERETGVTKEILLAIWATESNYGSFRGTRSVFHTLTRKAFAGDRGELARNELMAAFEIAASGIDPNSMTSGAGGAMGHMQFLPSTYLAHAVDGDGDGDRDIWGDDPLDALASAAHYLAALGWQRNLPWGLEVRLPREFDWRLVGEYEPRPATLWRERGVILADGAPLPDMDQVALIAPVGAHGPVFAVTANFATLRAYNKSVAYALAVGHLADRIAGGAPITASWPRGSQPLTSAEQAEVQERLSFLGYEPGDVDGRIGPQTIEAIQAWQYSRGILPDGFMTTNLLETLRTQTNDATMSP